MANITLDQVGKINARCGNGWKFDCNFRIIPSGEKAVVKYIKLDENHFLKCHMYFSEVHRNFRRVGWNVTLHISKFTGSNGNFASSSGLGLFRDIPYSKERKQFSDIEKLTKEIDDEYIMEIYNDPENQRNICDDILLDKNGWHLHSV